MPPRSPPQVIIVTVPGGSLCQRLITSTGAPTLTHRAFAELKKSFFAEIDKVENRDPLIPPPRLSSFAPNSFRCNTGSGRRTVKRWDSSTASSQLAMSVYGVSSLVAFTSSLSLSSTFQFASKKSTWHSREIGRAHV